MRLPRHQSKGKVILFAGIAFVLVLVSLGIFITTNQMNAAQARATATAQAEQKGTNVANDATITSIAADDMAGTALVENATTTVEAQESATQQALATAVPPTMTAIASSSPDAPFHKLAFDDPLLNNELGYNWDDCFSNGGYTVSTGKGYPNIQTCLAKNTDFTDFFYQVDMKVNQGYCGGIIFRARNGASAYFEICQDQSYTFYTQKSGEGLFVSISGGIGKSNLIHGGLGQTNRLAVLVQGQTFTSYVNGQFLTSLTDQDKVTSHGAIGVAAHGGNQATSATFTNAAVWIP